MCHIVERICRIWDGLTTIYFVYTPGLEDEYEQYNDLNIQSVDEDETVIDTRSRVTMLVPKLVLNSFCSKMNSHIIAEEKIADIRSET